MTAVVWQRMLRILGDVNAISDASIHHLAFKTLLSVWRHLGEVRWGKEGGKEERGRERGRGRGREKIISCT